MKPARSFASDNNAGVHPEVLQAVAEANRGHTVGYGDDPYTAAAVQKFKRNFNETKAYSPRQTTRTSLVGARVRLVHPQSRAREPVGRRRSLPCAH